MPPTIEGQAEINGLLVGPGTPYHLVRFNPWRRQVRADQVQPRAWSHGTWSGAEWRAEIIIDIELHYGATTHAEWLTLNDTASAAFAPVGDTATDVELRFMRGGSEALWFGRPRTFEPEMRPAQLRSFAFGTFVTTSKPFRFSAALNTSGAVVLPTYVGGLTWPMTVPYLIEATRVGGSADLVNAGTAPAGISFRIDGPVVEPRISVQHPDGSVNTLTFDLTLPAGQWLEVDTGSRTVFINGLPQSSARGQVTASPDWPLVQPGINVLRFGAANNAAGTVTATWRSAYW